MQDIVFEKDVDFIFKALADTTRRKIMELLSRGDASVKELASHFTHSLPSLMQHLSILEASGLINTKKVGRVRTCSLDINKLDVIDTWIAEQHVIWEHRMDRLELFIQNNKKDTTDE